MPPTRDGVFVMELLSPSRSPRLPADPSPLPSVDPSPHPVLSVELTAEELHALLQYRLARSSLSAAEIDDPLVYLLGHWHPLDDDQRQAHAIAVRRWLSRPDHSSCDADETLRSRQPSPPPAWTIHW